MGYKVCRIPIYWGLGLQYSNKDFTLVVTSPLAGTGEASNIVGTLYDTGGAVHSTLTFVENVSTVYQSTLNLPRGSYTLVVSVPWDIDDVVEHINVVDQPLTTVEYLGMRG
jgi:hypothetical protein